MYNRRIIGVVTVRKGIAVQSFGYNKYLPIGDPKYIIENLDRWGVDEILLQVIDRENQGPDFNVLSDVTNSKIHTPLIYSGGILNCKHAIEVIRSGADRIAIDSMLYNNINEVSNISHILGAQAIIAAIPSTAIQHKLYSFNYRSKQTMLFSSREELIKLFKNKIISEALVIDYLNEGMDNSFNMQLLALFDHYSIPIILFGGINSKEQLNEIFLCNNVHAVAIGNFLNYKEHAVQNIKNMINNRRGIIRTAHYCNEEVL